MQRAEAHEEVLGMPISKTLLPGQVHMVCHPQAAAQCSKVSSGYALPSLTIINHKLTVIFYELTISIQPTNMHITILKHSQLRAAALFHPKPWGAAPCQGDTTGQQTRELVSPTNAKT